MRRMFVARSRGRLLAGAGVAAAAVGMALLSGGSSDADAPAAQIPGAPLQAAITEPAKPIPAPALLRGGEVVRAPQPPPAPPEIDLSTIELEGDHYVAKLADGRKATLTLDPDLQELAEDLLVESRAPRAAIVAMSPDGKILALAGRRAAKQEGSREGAFDNGLATDAWAPAASVFKLATASALVDAGVDPSDKVCFHGGLRSVNESNLRDSKLDSRCETLGFGVAHSNNAILGKLAYQKLDPAQLDATASKLGWSQKLPGLHGQVGALALPKTKDLEFAQISAGFTTTTGGAKLSAVGGAVLASTFANNGNQPAPQLIASIVNDKGEAVEVQPPAAHRAISETTARAVGKMMVGTCDDGSAAKSFGRRNAIRVAGKTGTLTRTEPFYMEHSWFVGFAPAEQPKIIVSVLFGNPENWHLRGQEAARRLIDRATGRGKDRKRAKSRS